MTQAPQNRLTEPRQEHDWGELSTLQIFRDVSLEAIAPQLEACGYWELRTGEVLLSPEQSHDSVFVLVDGRLKVYLGAMDDPPHTTLYRGECAGEMSIIDKDAPSAWVMAVDRTRLLVIPSGILWSMIHASHALACNLLYTLSKRVRADNDLIVDNRQLLRRYEQEARVDPLTQLFNRRWLAKMFERERTRCQIDAEPLSIVVFDVDDLKIYNDRYGHLAGDQVLVAVADTLRTSMRPRDTPARIAGDEFVALLSGLASDEAVSVADRLRVAIQETSVGSEASLELPPVRVSVGVAQCEVGENLASVMKRADEALYRAKRKGRNCVSR